MNSKIIKNRIKAVRHRLKTSGINCLIVTKPANVTYTTYFSGDDSWVVITHRGIYLLTDSRYIEQAQNQCPHCRIIQRTTPMAKTVAKLLKKLKLVQTVAVEDSTSLAAFGALKRQVKARLKTVANIIESLRSSKDSSEIAAIKAAASIAAQALKQTLQETYFVKRDTRYERDPKRNEGRLGTQIRDTRLKSGMTENELAGMLDFQIRKLGASNSFETIVAFGPNASRPHHQPGTRRLKKNDTILIDFGVRYKNYCCDLTRCFAVGRPGAFYKKVYDAVQQAQAAAIKMVKPGVEIAKVDAAARGVIGRNELPVYGHRTGHGLGLEVHEEPLISADSKAKLQPGMVFTIEPAVYIPGKLGVRIEDDILVTETGCKILTRNCPHMPFLPD